MTVRCHVFIDQDRDGTFDAGDEVIPREATWDRGRNADFSGDAQGKASFILNDPDGAFYNALDPGMPVHITSTDPTPTDRAHFYGFIQRVTPDAWKRVVSVTCYDPLRRYADIDSAVSGGSLIGLTGREFRRAVLDDIERGGPNLVTNPSFETDLAGWSGSGGTLSRISGGSPGGGSFCAQFVATTINQAASYGLYGLIPFFYAGQTYTLSADLRDTVGGSWTMVGFASGNSTERTVPVTTTWTRFTMTFVAENDAGVGTAGAVIQFRSSAAGTLQIDRVMVTRGKGAVTYSDAGIAGRWPNFVMNGSFGTGTLGWNDAWTNLVTNGSFEANTTGWSGSIARDTSAPYIGVGHGVVSLASGANFDFTGTFKAGVAYRCTLVARVQSGSAFVIASLGSIGTPADVVSQNTSIGTGYTAYSFTWTPSADRTDARFHIEQVSGQVFYIDAVQVVRYNAALPFSNTGPGGGGSFTTSRGLTTAQSLYGPNSMVVVTPATSGAGVIYNFGFSEVLLRGGQPYTFYVWIRSTSAMPYKIGIGGIKADGTWDEASTTGTLTADTWTKVPVTWTPAADITTQSASYKIVGYIEQTNATVRTFYVGAAKMHPGSSADDFEMAHWILTNENDGFNANTAYEGTGASILSALNDGTLSHHFIRAKLTAPYYEYVTVSRDDYPAKTSLETYTNTFRGFEEGDKDLDSIFNIAEVVWGGGQDPIYKSDPASIDIYGPRIKRIDISKFGYLTLADVIGQMIIDRYSMPRARPSMEVTTRFPSQLVRDIDDLITLSLDRLSITSRKYLIVRLSTKVTKSSEVWETKYALEEHAY